MSDVKKLSKVFKALSNPNRLELYLKIKNHHKIEIGKKKRACLLSSLCESLNIGAPTISHHLKELMNAELVETDKQGKFITCNLNQSLLNEVIKELKS
ncbi:helix-turn-helix transcriptional regulator [bacterium]|nr:helix-turn-helix transcriptional regulator [bacterium]